MLLRNFPHRYATNREVYSRVAVRSVPNAIPLPNLVSRRISISQSSAVHQHVYRGMASNVLSDRLVYIQRETHVTMHCF